MEAKGKAAKAVLNHPLRILAMNCQSIKNKKANFIQLSTRQNQTSSFDADWKDRASDAHGGVFTASSVTCSVLKLRNWTPTVKKFGVRRTFLDAVLFFDGPLTRLIMINLRSLNHFYHGLCLTEMHMFWLEEILIAVI